MVDLPRRMFERGGVGLVSREEPHIYRDPPKSVWTRKKERITEADVMWMTRPDGSSSDPTRINESIQEYARSINPSVEIDYRGGGGGSRTTSIPMAQAGSTYKLQVVRPPLFPAETLLPLSRPRIHQNKSVESNPGLPGNIASATNAYNIDINEVTNAINSSTLTLPVTTTATAYYKIETPSVMSAKYAVNDEVPNAYANTNPNDTRRWEDMICRENTPYGSIVRPKTNYEVNSNPNINGETNRNDDASGHVRASMIIENVRPNFQIVVYDPNNHVATEVASNIREKQNIAVRAAVGAPISFTKIDGTKVLARNYNWTVVNSAIGLDQVILTLEDPDIELDRNVPLYSSYTNLNTPSDILQRLNDEYKLQDGLHANANTNPSLRGYNEEGLRNNIDNVNLREKLPTAGFTTDFYSHPSFESYRPAQQLRGNDVHKTASRAGYTRAFQV